MAHIAIFVIYGTVSAKTYPLLILCWDKNALRLNRNNFQTVIAINILFSELHTTPFFYGKSTIKPIWTLAAAVSNF